MICIHKSKHLGPFKYCCNCKQEITVGHLLEINSDQYIICRDCRTKLKDLVNIDDKHDHMLTSDRRVY